MVLGFYCSLFMQHLVETAATSSLLIDWKAVIRKLPFTLSRMYSPP